MGKRKAESTADRDESKEASKTVKRTKKAGAEQIGLTYEAFEKSAPKLSMKLYEAKTKTSSKTPTSSTESKILELDLPKTLHGTGSYGYTSSGKRIMIEVEVDGKKEQVPAIVTGNVTIAGSKKSKAEADDSVH